MSGNEKGKSKDDTDKGKDNVIVLHRSKSKDDTDSDSKGSGNDKKAKDSDECSATTEWLDENSCPRGHLGGQFGCDFCDYPGEPLAGTSNLRKFLMEQGWDKYDARKHYMLSKKAKDKDSGKKDKGKDTGSSKDKGRTLSLPSDA